MSWAQENKFLAGLIAVTVVGAGALGYLTFSAMGKYDAASEALEKTASEKKRLETLPVYPNAENLKKLQVQKEEHLVRIEELQRQMKKMELPEESLTPQGFQDRLRTAVTAYTRTAGENHMKLPEKFYMGFGEYQTKTPDDKTALKLAKQLRAIEQVLGFITQYRAIELKKVFRLPLPEEGGPAAKPAAAAAVKPGAKKGAEPAAPLVTKQPFEVAFVGEQGTLQAVLNAIATTKSPFYIVRNVVVQNTQPKPPTKEGAAVASTEPAPAAPAPAPAPAPDGANPAAAPAPEAAPAPQAEALKFIIGEEKVEAQIEIEIVEFAEPPQKETKGKKK